MQDIIFGLDPERNPTQVRVDESGFMRIGSSVAIARTTNPTALADGIFTPLSADKVGRLLHVPYQLRDLVSTAYVSVSTGSETTLLAGVASTFLDLINLTCSNQSSAAVQVDLRSETGAGIVETIYIPATTTIQTTYNVPKRQNTVAATWTVDLPDITGTTVTVSADFVQNL